MYPHYIKNKRNIPAIKIISMRYTTFFLKKKLFLSQRQIYREKESNESNESKNPPSASKLLSWLQNWVIINPKPGAKDLPYLGRVQRRWAVSHYFSIL